MFGKIRKGFSMRINGVQLNRPDMHVLAAELGIAQRDVLIKDGVLTVYNTSDACQEIIDDNSLISFVSMSLNVPPEDITDLQEVEEEPVKFEFDFDDDEDDD